MIRDFIPISTPKVDGNELNYVTEAVKSGWISSEGPFVKKFEEAFSSFCERDFGTLCSSGTAALLLAMRSLGIGEGDEVIIPDFTIISCAQAVISLGAKPVPVDCSLEDFNILTSKLEEKITKKTKAILAVHTYGLSCDMDLIGEVASKHKLFVIEDAAQAHGLMYKGKPCGSFGDVSIFSFYANKNITMGEGGILLSNSKKIYEKSLYYRNLCFEKENRFVHKELGYNMRITNLQAAIGLAQLETLQGLLDRKKELGRIYRKELLEFESVLTLPKERNDFSENSYWVYPLVAKKKFTAKEIIKKLSELGVGSRPFFYPISKQPVFKSTDISASCCPNAEHLSLRGFYLPCDGIVSNEEVRYVATSLKEILK